VSPLDEPGPPPKSPPPLEAPFPHAAKSPITPSPTTPTLRRMRVPPSEFLRDTVTDRAPASKARAARITPPSIDAGSLRQCRVGRGQGRIRNPGGRVNCCRATPSPHGRLCGLDRRRRPRAGARVRQPQPDRGARSPRRHKRRRGRRLPRELSLRVRLGSLRVADRRRRGPSAHVRRDG
jgi:hypothetical protein